MSREWKPGDVARIDVPDGGAVGIWTGEFWAWSRGDGPYEGVSHCHRSVLARPLVVIDPEDREQVERLRDAVVIAMRDHELSPAKMPSDGQLGNALQAALREFANPTPDEPTDPRAVVTDRRENTWRLLADGDWICTSGPDHGEYLSWAGLLERGPLTVEVPR